LEIEFQDLLAEIVNYIVSRRCFVELFAVKIGAENAIINFLNLQSIFCTFFVFVAVHGHE
jgi:hypothetical protein